MLKRLLTIILISLYTLGRSQCPQIIDYLGNATSTPQFISCTAGDYAVNFQATSSFGAYTINWGDGTANATGTAYTTNSIIPHTYTNTIGTFTLTLSIPSAACTRTALVVMERPVSASIQIPLGGVTQVCAPKTLTFTNSSTNVSSTTTFTWDFGDGSTPVVFDASNVNQNVTHNYLKNTVTCQTQVTLKALNYCRFNNPSAAVYNPIQIYDVDVASATADKAIRCLPDNLFTFTNNTNRNCVPEGNTFQRQERWNLGNYWGYGHDSIIDWRPWPPTTPVSVAFPAVVGGYNITLYDSNLCGVATKVIAVSIVNAPTAGLLVPSGNLCQNTSITFSNTSSSGYTYLWDFGDGGGLNNLGGGNKSHTYSSSGTYTVKVVAQLPGGAGACISTATVPVNIIGSPAANFTFSPAAGCTSLSGVTFTDLSTGAASYTWNFGNGNTSNSAAPPPQNYLTTGAFTASLLITGATSCVNTKTASVIVRPTPVPNFITISPCVAAAGNFTSTSTVTGTNAITNYTWSFGDATANSTAASPSHTYLAPGTYTVKLIAATAFCKDSISKPVSVNVRPTPDFAFTPTINCPPFAASFTNSSSNATNYLWRFGTASTATSNATSPSFTYANATQNVLDYTVTLISSTGLGCADSIKKAISVKPKPIAAFSSTTTGGCSPLVSTFSNSSIGATTYSWSFGDATTSTLTSPPHTYTNVSVLLQTNTITLVATNSLSCTDTIKHTIQIFPQPLTTFTMTPGSGCTPLTVNFPPVPGIVSYTWNFGDGSAPVAASTPTFHVFTNTTTATQTFTVKLIASNAFGCVDSSFKNPIVYSTPIPSFVPSNSTGCSPLTLTLTNLSTFATTYRWRFGDNTPTVTVTDATHTYTNPSNSANQTFTCTLTAYSTNGCSDSLKKSILVYYKPLAAFINNDPQCVSTTISFTNNSSGNDTFAWNFGDATAVSTATSPTHSYTNNTISNINYTVQLVATSPNICRDTTYGYPVAFAHPVSSYGVGPTTGCSPLTTTLTNASLYAHTYIWRLGDLARETTTNVVHTYTNTSNTTDHAFTSTLVAINNNGCKDSTSRNVTAFYKPHAAFLQSAPGCLSKIISFTNTTEGVSTSSWNFGDLSALSTSASPSHTYINNTLNNLNFTVQLVVTSPNVCRDTAYGYPVIFAHPIAAYVITPTVGCSPVTSTLSNGSNFAHTYLWRFGDGATSTSTNTSHTYSNTSNTTNQIITCTLVAYNNNGCKDSVKKNVLVLYKPKALFTESDPKCLSQTITFTNNSLGAAVNSWTFGDGSPVSTSVTPTHAYINNTLNNLNFTVQLIVTTASLCADTAYGHPEIYAIPRALLAITPTVGCSPLIATLSNSSTAAHTYKWKFGDGTTSTLQATGHTYTNTSNSSNQSYTTTLVVYNNNGCRDSMSVPLSVFYKPKVMFSLDTPACTPKLITFTNSSIGLATYNWDFGDGATSTSSAVTHQYVNSTPFNQTYTVVLRSTTPDGCKDTMKVPMTVHPKQSFIVNVASGSGCTPLNVIFQKIVGFNSFQWLKNGSPFTPASDGSQKFTNDSHKDTEVDTISVNAKDIYGCPAATGTTFIHVFPVPLASFDVSPDSVYIPSQPVTLTNLSIGGSTYSWTLGDGTTANSFNLTHAYSEVGDYQITLTVENSHGCEAKSTSPSLIKAKAATTVQMPNAFTPNPAGSPGNRYTPDTDRGNMVFHPNVIGASKYEFSVYSRWGELLFETKRTDEGWDGYYRGQICTQDVYIWKVVATFVDGKVYSKTGDLLLLR